MAEHKSPIKSDRKPGISFVVRCRNEENYIADCITSLSDLTILYEVVVILHMCTDRSKEIVEQLKSDGYPIRVYEYDHEVSRPGYEALVTPKEHLASLMTYYNFCFGKAKYNWIMKWDADFKASPELIDYLNNRVDLDATEPIAFRIGCVMGDSGKVNAEYYMSNVLLKFNKHIFWEVPNYSAEVREITLKKEQILSISPKVLKAYWKQTPWFLRQESYDQDLDTKYQAAVKILGPEPVGLARASNPASDAAYYRVKENEAALAELGIKLYD